MRWTNACDRSTWCTPADTDEFNEDDPAAADGCILQNDDFLQYYLGAYIRATPGQSFDDANERPYALKGVGPFNGQLPDGNVTKPDQLRAPFESWLSNGAALDQHPVTVTIGEKAESKG